MGDAPKRIWLQVDPEGERYDDPLSGWDGATWCQDQINKSDIEFVRADEIEDMKHEIERLEAEVVHLEAIVENVDGQLIYKALRMIARRAGEKNDE